MTADDTFPPSVWTTIITEKVKKAPSSVFCEIHEKEWRETGTRKITYTQFSRAVNRACWWLDDQFGPSKNFDSFTYVGDNDLRYTIAMVAAQKSQRKMVLAELNRLTHSALLLLLEDTKCHRWLGGSEAQTALGSTLPAERPGTELYTLPPLEYWLADGDVEEYVFEKSWEQACKNPVFVIHSSGTTGVPKSLTYTLEMLAITRNTHRSPDGTIDNPTVSIRPMFDSRILWSAPPQWIGGIVGHVAAPLFFDAIPVWPPVHEGAPTPAPVIEEILNQSMPDGAFYVPSTMRDLCLKESSLDLVKKHKFIIYAGAPLDLWVGDLLCKETELIPVTGATETNIWAQQKIEDPRDWKYYRLDKRLGYRLEHYQDDMYEVVLDKKPEYRRYQGAFIMYPEKDVYHTQDLYTPHPSKPDLLLYRGRKDDLVKLSWLTKVRASDMESALNLNRQIAEAMVGGEGKPTPFVILQLSKTAGNLEESDLWSIVKALNEKISAEIHVPRENIILTDESRPLKKLGKGTLDRRGILADYQEEIARLYEKYGDAVVNGVAK